MLTSKELNEIKQLISQKRKNKITVNDLMELLEVSYTKDNPLLQSFKTRNLRECITTIKQDKSKTSSNAVVRTADDSMLSDEVRNTKKAGK